MPFRLARLAAGWPTLLACIAAVGLASVASSPAWAQTGDEAAANNAAGGRYLALKSPIDDRTVAKVKNAAQELLRSDAGGTPVLVLEVPAGTSQYHNVYPLAEFLASPAAAGLKTVAWIPETVTGYNAILPLACDEIVMHPEAKLGDIGRGESLPDNRRQFVLEVVRQQSNRLVTEALAESMLDPAVSLLRVQTQPEPGATETRIVTRGELEALRAADVVVSDVQKINDRGQIGLFGGAEARENGLLVTRLGFARGEVAEKYGLSISDFDRVAERNESVRARLIRVDGNVDPLLESFLERQIDRAEADGANLVVFEIDSRSGELFVSMQLANKVAALEDRGIRTVAWVPNFALGPASLIAVACDEIYMAPDAKIGDAIARRPEQTVENSQLAVQTLRELARAKGRSPALAAAFADATGPVFEATDADDGNMLFLDEEELHAEAGAYIKGRQIDGTGEGGRLLLDAQDAERLKIAQGVVADFESVQDRIGLPIDQSITTVSKTWVDSLVFFLNDPWVTAALLMISIALVYLELHFMSGVLSIGAVLCFALFFWARVLGGTAGSLEVVLFVLGIALIAMEVFVIPGFGVCGITGAILMLASLIMASQTFQGITVGESVTRAGKTVSQLGGALIGVVIFASVVSRFLPRIPIFRDLVLAPPGGEASGTGVRLRPDLNATSIDGIVVGDRGKAITTLRPAGKARLGEDLVDVVSEGPYIEPSTPVEVVEVAGNRIVVREVG